MATAKLLLDIFITFMKIGGLTFGGGYTMFPIIQQEAVDNKKWVSEEEMVDYIAMAQSLPGVIAINTATAVGNRVGGFAGAITATLGIITPSLVIIMLIAVFYDQFKQWTILNDAFMGIRAAVVALIVVAIARMAKTAVTNGFQLFVAVGSLVAIVFFSLSPPFVIIASALLSIFYHIIYLDKKGRS